MAGFDKGYPGAETGSREPFSEKGSIWKENELADDLKRRIEKALDALCLVFVLLWLFSVWKWPFGFLADYIQIFFILCVVFGYAGSIVGAKVITSILSRTATTSFEFILLVWVFAPNGAPWDLYLSYLGTAFVFLFIASITAGGSISDKWERVSDRVGGFLHGIAFILVLFWLFGSKGRLAFIGLPVSFFPDYLLLAGFAVYILGSVTKSASFPLHRVALERASYSVAMGCLGSVIVTIAFRWVGFLPYFSLPDIERMLFLLFVGWLVVSVVVSTTKSAELKAKENEVKAKWWWERFSKPIRESARRLSEELKGLRLSDAAYVLPLGGQLVKTERVSVESRPDTIVVPLTLAGEEVGAVYVGSGEYSLNANVKQFSDRFDGDMVVFTNPKTWEAIKSEQKLLQAYPEEIKRAGFDNLEDIRKLAEGKLNQFRFFGERVQTLGERDSMKYGRVHIPGINIEEGPGYEKVHLPFIDVRSDRDGDYVRVGPLKVWDSGGKSVVKFGPFLAVDESVPEAIAKPNKILITIWDRSGSDIDIATLKDEIIFHKGTMSLHVDGDQISFREDGSAVRVTRKLKEIRTPRLWLLVKPKIKAVVRSGSFKFKAFANGVVYLRSRTGEVIKTRDRQLALRLIQQLDETVDDLSRAVLEKRELEEVSEFFSKMDETFKEENKSS
ncbi:MAG: hypothetical protein WED04_12725 [Promethearchaeati archaeon SRVP18_Atabeyarchaeia-1]